MRCCVRRSAASVSNPRRSCGSTVRNSSSKLRDSDGETGARLPLEGSLARAALERAGTFAVLDAEREREFTTVDAGVRSALSAAFRVGDEAWAVTFSSASCARVALRSRGLAVRRARRRSVGAFDRAARERYAHRTAGVFRLADGIAESRRIAGAAGRVARRSRSAGGPRRRAVFGYRRVQGRQRHRRPSRRRYRAGRSRAAAARNACAASSTSGA